MGLGPHNDSITNMCIYKYRERLQMESSCLTSQHDVHYLMLRSQHVLFIFDSSAALHKTNTPSLSLLTSLPPSPSLSHTHTLHIMHYEMTTINANIAT